MDLNAVSVFVRVVEARGFTAAAKQLGLPKSSVSRAVSRLEDELGAKLLRRSTRSVGLTEAGTAFYERASRALVELSEASSDVRGAADAVRGTVRVTAPPDMGAWLLAPVLWRLVREHPHLRVELVLTSRLVNLEEEAIDLALRAGAVANTATLVAKRLRSDEIALFASKRYLDERGTPTTLAALDEHDLVLFRPVGGSATVTLVGPDGPETIVMRGRLGADDFLFVCRALAEGAGIGLLPAFMPQEPSLAGPLVRVLPQYALRPPVVHLVYPTARFVPPRVLFVRDFLLEALASEPTHARSADARGQLGRQKR